MLSHETANFYAPGFFTVLCFFFGEHCLFYGVNFFLPMFMMRCLDGTLERATRASDLGYRFVLPIGIPGAEML